MALNAKFEADFSKFYDAVSKASVSLKSFETDAHKVEGSLNRAANAFTGQRIQQQATIAVEAVERIGGVTKLTDKEQARLNATLTEAIAKYKALGDTAPKAMLDLEKATHQSTSALDKIKGTILSVAGTLGIAFGAQQLVSFVGTVMEAAGEIDDLSKKLGISTAAVQRFQYAAQQSGASLEDVQKAVFNMNKSFGEASTKTRDTVTDLGLSFNQLRGMTPEDAFLALATAIEGIEDPMEQARIATELFGKAGATLLPALKQGFGEAAKAASVMSDETIKRLADAEDAWGNLKRGVVIQTGEMVAHSLKTLNELKAQWDAFKTYVANFTVKPGGTGEWGEGLKKRDAEMRAELERRRQQEIALPGVPTGTRAEFEVSRPNQFGAAGATEAEIAGIEKGSKALLAAGDAAAKYAEDVKALRAQLSGAALAGDVKRLTDAFKGMTPAQKASAEVLDRYGEAARKLYEEGAQLSPELFTIMATTQQLVPAATDASIAITNVGTSFKMWYDSAVPIIPVLNGINSAVGATFKMEIPRSVTDAADRTKKLNDAFNGMVGSLVQMGQLAGGTFGGMAQGLGTVLGAGKAAKDAFGTLKTAMQSKDKLEGVLGMASGVMGIVSAAMMAVQAVKAIWDAFAPKGRNMVKDFAEGFGGFDKLHEELNLLGAEGEALWIKLTQGVGRNNPEQAKRVIAEVEDALTRYHDKQKEVKDTTEEQAQATIETATEAQKALDDLTPRIKDNETAWKEWGDFVTGQIAGVAAALRDLPILAPSTASAGVRGPGQGATAQNTINIHAIDGPSVKRIVESPDFAAAFEQSSVRNNTGIGSTIRRVTA